MLFELLWMDQSIQVNEDEIREYSEFIDQIRFIRFNFFQFPSLQNQSSFLYLISHLILTFSWFKKNSLPASIKIQINDWIEKFSRHGRIASVIHTPARVSPRRIAGW